MRELFYTFSVMLFVGCGLPVEPMDIRTIAMQDAYGLTYAITLGVSGGDDPKFEFIAISGSSSGMAEAIVESGWSTGSANSRWARAIHPDGTTIELPDENIKILQLIDGEWSQSNRGISIEVWERFVKSQPERYTLDAIFQFAGEEERMLYP